VGQETPPGGLPAVPAPGQGSPSHTPGGVQTPAAGGAAASADGLTVPIGVTPGVPGAATGTSGGSGGGNGTVVGGTTPPGLVVSSNSVAVDVVATVTARLSGATGGAQGEFQAAVQAYAARLAQEAEAQEISNRPPGVLYPEISANAVVRAKDVLARFGSRARRGNGELAALVATPVSFTVAGVFGSYLNDWWQWGGMCGSSTVGLIALVYLARKRIL
jgi:hypothetical protein